MSKYHPGEVVVVSFPFQEGNQVKTRPALILSEDAPDEYLLCQITSRNRSATHKGIWVMKDSSEGKHMCIETDSFINAEVTAVVNKYAIHKMIGICSHLEQILQMVYE